MDPILERELVERTKRIAEGVRDRREDRYDGMTESGPGPFFALVPGRPADRLADHYDEMDPLPWADSDEEFELDPADPETYAWIEKIDRYTDGAILVGGDGRVHPYTVHLDPPESRGEGYEEGWGTKTRTALDISATDLPDLPETELDYLREFPGAYDGHVDAPVEGGVWDTRSHAYGDVVAVTISSKNGQGNLFDRGRSEVFLDPARTSRDLDEVWDEMAQEIERSREAEVGPPVIAEQYTVDDPSTRTRVEAIVDAPGVEEMVSEEDRVDGDGPATAATADVAQPAAED